MQKATKPRKLNAEDEQQPLDGLVGSDVNPQSVRLLAAIIKIARDDWLCLENDEGKVDGYCDKTHRAMASARYFIDGRHELRTFFYSEWYESICDAIGLNTQDVRDYIKVP